MFGLLRYIPRILFLFKDVTKAIRNDKGQDRPKYLSRRVIGAVLLLVATISGIALKVEISPAIIENITEHLDTAIVAGIGLWGLIMEIVGIVKRKKE